MNTINAACPFYHPHVSNMRTRLASWLLCHLWFSSKANPNECSMHRTHVQHISERSDFCCFKDDIDWKEWRGGKHTTLGEPLSDIFVNGIECHNCHSVAHYLWHTSTIFTELAKSASKQCVREPVQATEKSNSHQKLHRVPNQKCQLCVNAHMLLRSASSSKSTPSRAIKHPAQTLHSPYTQEPVG